MVYISNTDTTITAPLTAFGEVATASKHPEMQWTFPSHVDHEELSVTTTSTGNATVTANQLVASTACYQVAKRKHYCHIRTTIVAHDGIC